MAATNSHLKLILGYHTFAQKGDANVLNWCLICCLSKVDIRKL
jgi:hypothetical protein